MKSRISQQTSREAGNALLMTMILSGVALAILAAAMAWSTSSARLTHRVIQRDRSVSAAEGATEKVVSLITRDYMYGGESLVVNNLNSYRTTLPTAADSQYWSTWQFDDGNGHTGQTSVERAGSTTYAALDPTYAGLKGFITTYAIASHAKDQASVQDVNAGVLQQVQLAGIPIFQFAMYSSGDMEISCGQPFDVTGRVHSNKSLYVEPDNTLTFESGVTAVVSNIFGREPLDTRGPPSGGVVYVHPELKLSPVQALTLPIGTTNSPEAIREIIEPAPGGESPSSPLGKLRYHNLCDMIITASDGGVIAATSGRFNNFATVVPLIELTNFVSVFNSFWDAREGKTVLPIDIDVGALAAWNMTNQSLRFVVPGADVTSIYVVDARHLAANQLGAVRVFNGLLLPRKGLTVATGRPLYVWGDYNEYNPAYLGTSNTTATLPASLVGDAITVLSDAWVDANSSTENAAAATTVNAAFLTGVVETTAGHYSGGMENFPRFLENWGSSHPFTYNGSMIKMFPSLYATGAWGGGYYSPPKRQWAFDAKFDDPLGLPPKTPQLQLVVRKQWASILPGQNTPPATH